MTPIEVQINIDDLYAIKNLADAVEIFKKAADENESKANRLADEVNALRAELDAKNTDCNDIPVMPKDIADTFRTAEDLLFAEEDSHLDTPFRDEFVQCVRDFVASLATYFTIPRGGAE